MIMDEITKRVCTDERRTKDEANAIPISTFRSWANEKDLARENERGRRKTWQV